ncbi:MAG: alpha-amylase family glycosyl hydrolase [Chloroflexota bacterium]|nr:alpha-amylase family glycosyl hydrolase [Chloroflexota bacterium]
MSSEHHTNPQSSQDLLWWQRGVVYQIYPRSFKDTTSNGTGDLQGVIDRLDHLNDGTPDSLGIDAIWLSPFYPSPMADFGYDVADYCDVDPLFGDLATFDRLVADAHRRGVKIIIDYVPNHSSDQHPWFIQSRSSRDNPKRDWYTWRDPKPDGSPPNNWLSVFGGLAWEWDETSGQYYLHSFLKEQPDLNWRNPDVKAAMFDVLRFWLERGVDGFRIDVAHYIMKDPHLRDNLPNPSQRPAIHRPLGDYDSQLHLHDKGHPDVHEVYRQFRQLLDAYSAESPRVSVGEIHIFDWPKWASYYGEQLDELHMPFNFALLNVEWRAQAICQVVDALEAALPPSAWPNYVLGNHDEPRLASRYGRDQARVAGLLLLTLRGTPTLYYGDELGLGNGIIPPDKIQDPQGINLGAEHTRDVCRTPMQWDGSPNAGFSDVEPWLPVSADYGTRNVAVQSADPTSILNLYRRLLWYRRGSPALYGGTYRPLDVGDDDCFVYLRTAGDERRLIALNFTDDQRYISVPGEDTGQIVISTHLDREEKVSLSRLELRPHEGLIVEL